MRESVRPLVPPAWPASAPVVRPAEAGVQPIRTVLAITDFSVQGDQALECAAQLAAAQGATLKVLHAHHPRAAPCPEPRLRMQIAVREWSERLPLRVVPIEGVATSLRQIADHAAGADLLVMAHGERSTLAKVLLGPAAVRLARLSPCPVLVVRRRARGAFARILVAVDLARASRALVKWACAIGPDAQVELFHAVSQIGESRLRQFDASVQGMRAYQRKAMQMARARLAGLVESLGLHDGRLLHAAGYGDPAQQALAYQGRIGADLMVIGMRRQSALSALLLGNTARHALDGGSGNVLIVPYGAADASAGG